MGWFRGWGIECVATCPPLDPIFAEIAITSAVPLSWEQMRETIQMPAMCASAMVVCVSWYNDTPDDGPPSV